MIIDDAMRRHREESQKDGCKPEPSKEKKACFEQSLELVLTAAECHSRHSSSAHSVSSADADGGGDSRPAADAPADSLELVSAAEECHSRHSSDASGNPQDAAHGGSDSRPRADAN